MRLMRVAVQEEFLRDLLRDGAIHDFSIEKGIPSDAVLVRCYSDPGTTVGEQVIWLVYQSRCFNDIPPGSQIPELTIEVKEASG